MSDHHASQSDRELESRRVAEASRETEWQHASFLKELFLGSFRLDLIHPFPPAAPDRPEFQAFFDRLVAYIDTVDSVAIDATGEYPPALIEELKRLGAFAMKIPTDYGGLGFNQQEYNRVMEYLGSVDGNICALLSAHQSIGVPQPIKLFGTPEQKQRFLTRCANGELSAFALTEPGVGSDPAQLNTTAMLSKDGSTYVVNGEKLWCTNGTLADLLVVMAKNPETNKISAFVVETKSPGVTIEHRCRFMGLRALSNAIISFRNVQVPRDNLIGREGSGLKIALVTLNTGRLTLPASCVGAVKSCLEMTRRWASVREQWGLPIGKHESIAHKIADIGSTLFAMESMAALATRLADRGGYDIRLEAAAAKEWNTTRCWRIVDDTLQIRGGRGYETEQSLRDRGDAPLPIERLLRDVRINTLFEGSSEVMHLFIAREAVDRHLQVAGVMIDPKQSVAAKLKALPGIAWFYARWYSARWLGWGRWPRYAEHGALATHLRFAERRTRKLAREVFHAMVFYAAKMQKKQAFLFRVVDIGLELCVMTASVARARAMRAAGDANADAAEHMADLFCRDARRRIDGWFHALWHNDDGHKYGLSRSLLAGDYAWMETGIRNLTISDDELRPRELTTPSVKPEAVG